MNIELREQLESRIASLRAELLDAERQLQTLEDEEQVDRSPHLPMRLDEYRRYGRQMILPGFGLQGQLKLRKARVLVVGAGGLGCPLLLYLAAAGIGHVTIVDSDTVEVSNLHRQVLHTMATVGLPKVDSAAQGVRRINPLVDVRTIYDRFTRDLLRPINLDSADRSARPPAVELAGYDLAIDCTDNARTRYLLSDECVKANVTLVSGGAVGLEGWSGVWNLPPQSQPALGQEKPAPIDEARGPCLRCIYPQTKYDNSGNCEDEGVLGTVVGTIGMLMAGDAIKLLAGLHDLKPCMTLYSPLSNPMFRNIKLRGRKPTCPGCGPDAQATTSLDSNDTEEVCGVLEETTDSRLPARELLERLGSKGPSPTSRAPLLIDVRPESEYSICSIPGSINLPHSVIQRDPSVLVQAIQRHRSSETDNHINDVLLVCRRGNDSLLDARLLRDVLDKVDGTDQVDPTRARPAIDIKDVRGGLRAWAAVNPGFPLY